MTTALRSGAAAISALAFLGAVAACSDFTLPPAPQPPPPPGFTNLTVHPASAFAGERVRLVADPPMALGGLEFQIGGQRVVAERETGELVVPFFENACRRELLVEAADPSLLLKPATLTWLGPGHPGRPRPRLTRETPVRFSPTRLRAIQGGVIASAFGSVIASIGGDLRVREASHIGDFVAAMDVTLGGSDPRVFYMGRHGGFGVLEASGRTGEGGADPVVALPAAPAVQTVLPSVIYSGPTELAMLPGGKGSASGTALGQLGDVPPQRVVYSPLSATAQLSVEPHPLAAELAGRSPLVINSGAGMQFFAAAAPPTVELAFASSPDKSERILLGHGDALPVALAAQTGASTRLPESTFLASVWRGSIGREQSGSGSRDGGVEEADGGEQTPGAGSVELDGGLVLTALTAGLPPRSMVLTSEDFDHLAMVWSPPNPIDDLGALEVVAAHEESALLWRFRVRPDQLTISYQEVLPLPAPARALAAVLDDDGTTRSVRVVVRDAQGGLNTFVIPNLTGPGRQTGGGAVRVSLVGADARATESCGDQTVVVASRALGSTGVVSVDGSAEPAWFPGSRAATATAAVELTREHGESNLVFFASLGPSGLLITESVVQARAEDRAVRLDANEPSFPALPPGSRLLTPVQLAPDRAQLVVGGDAGLAAVAIGRSFDPHAPPVPRLFPKCPGVVRLVSAGPLAIALSRTGATSRLCVLDAARDELEIGPAFPAAWDVRALAPMLTGDPEVPEGRRASLLLAGVDSGRLLLAQVALEQAANAPPVPIDLAPIATLLPQGSPSPSALALSPDGRRAFLGMGGSAPGVLVFDPVLLAAPGTDEQQRREAVVSLATSAAPLAFSVPSDGMRVIAVLENDRLAIIE